MKLPLRLLLLSLIFSPLASFAGIVPVTPGKIYTDPSGPAVVMGTATAKTWVTMPSTSFGTHIDRFKQGVITLGVDHHYPQIFANSRIQVELLVRRFSDADTTTHVDDTTVVVDVSDSPGDSMSFQDRHSISFYGFGSYSMKITNIIVNGSAVTTLPANLYIQADLFIDRIYDLSPYVGTAPAINSTTSQLVLDTDCDGVDDQLVLSWGVVPQAEEYQLEWVYINDYGQLLAPPISPTNLDVNFKFNSTCISTSNTSYAITLAFDRGYICYRVRAVGRNNTDLTKLIFSAWSTPLDQVTVSATDSYHHTTPFEVEKNWQYSTSYAEEGKKKEVVSFFDGSLRNRQMVTKINSDNNTVVGETIYDHQGRPAIQVLPTPVIDPDCSDPNQSASLKYYENFTQNTSGDPYNRENFDLSTGDPCLISTEPMGTDNGAANYYSPDNPDLNGVQGMLPDAEQFPFSQVEYTPDNTGRIRRQGGVGDEFQLGGHDTKYYYSHPFQEQLDRLFGSEVGYSSHYQKNMIIDPNGQVSVSYLDQEGRVIATSLAGENPENVEGIPSENFDAVTLTADLFALKVDESSTSNQLSADGMSNVFNETVSFSSPTSITLDYSVTLGPMPDPCVNFCFNCVYDLTIEIRDECGQLLTDPALNEKHIGRFTTDPGTGAFIFSLLCNKPSPQTRSESITITVPIGTYQITKILTVNEESIDYYVDRYFDPTYNTCIKTLEDFEEEYLENANFEDCDLETDCDACVAALGTIEEFMAAGNGNQEDYNDAIAVCKAPCESVSYCKTQEKILLGDLSPGGQYAEFEQNDGSVNPGTFSLSILNTNNILPLNGSGTATWKNPQFLENGSFVAEYRDEDLLTRSKVWLSAVTFSSPTIITGTLPVVDFGILNTDVFYDATAGQYYTYPEYLTNVEDFIGAFQQTSWGYSLLKYHPEYSFYKTCLEFTVPVPTDPLQAYTSESFDAKMLSASTWDDAITAGFIPLGYLSLPNTDDRINAINLTTNPVYDPFLLSSSTAFSPQNSQLYSKIFNYITISGTPYSMMEFAAMVTRAGNDLIGATPAPADIRFGDDFDPLDMVLSDAIRDAEWQYFRQLYLSEKQKQQYELSLKRSLTVSGFYGYNGCIQNDEFDPARHNFLDLTNIWGGSIPASQYFNAIQPCQVGTKDYYINKKIRFTTPTDLIDNNPNAVAYQQYLLTGQCPVTSALENLLSEAAQNNLLESATTFSMNDELQYTSALFLALNMDLPVTTVPVLDWDQVTMTSTSISVNFVQVPSAFYGSFTLTKLVGEPVVFTWADIQSFHSLSYTYFGSGVYNFDVVANVTIGIGTIVPVHLQGTTTFNIGSCLFEEVCELSDLGKDLEVYIKAITASGNFGSGGFSTNGTDMEDLFTPTMSYAVENYGTPDPKWVFDAGIPAFRINELNNGNVWNFVISQITPPSFSLGSIGSVGSVTSIEANQGNTFDILCADGAGNHLVTFTCTSVGMWNNTGIPLGSCDLPTPALCEGTAYDNPEYFGDLLLEWGEEDDVPSTIDLALIDDNIVGQLPTDFDGFNLSEYTEGDLSIVDLEGHGTCDMTFSIDHAEFPSLDFQYITQILGYQPAGVADNYSNYHEIIIKVEYYNGSTEVGEVRLKTCLPLRVCDDCIDTIPLFDTVVEQQFEYKSVENYKLYTQALNDLNKQNNWTAENGLKVEPIAFRDFFRYGMGYDISDYLKFIAGFDSKIDNKDYLIDPLVFFSRNYEKDKAEGIEKGEEGCKDEWIAYGDAIDAFNLSAWAGYHNVVLVNLYPNYIDFVESGKCDCIRDYLRYIDDYITADKRDELPMPMTLVEFCGGGTPCEEGYQQYLDCVSNFNDWSINNNGPFVISSVVSWEEFLSQKYCYCVDAYCAALFEIMNIKMEKPVLPDLKTLCKENEPPCTPDVPFTANVVVPEQEFIDPCVEFITNMAYSNALNAYNEYVDETTTAIRTKYINHCLSAVETMNLTYDEKEYHFTLYYYDQAGNLIKTVPPEGVEKLDLEANGNEILNKIKLDRANGTHTITTNHRMATKYEYNSLNQLVAQSMPDMDNMDIFEITLPNGLTAGLNTTAIQMVSENVGYLTGYLTNSAAPTGTRGYLYRTTNGGANWSRVYYTLGSDLNKVRMVNGTVGYAVGTGGILLRTANNGVSWDLVNTYGNSVTGDLSDLDLLSSGDLIVLAKNGTYFKITTPGTSTTIGAVSTLSLPAGTTLVAAKVVQSYSGVSGSDIVLTLSDGTNTFDYITQLTGSQTAEAIYGAEWNALYYYGTNAGMVGGVDGNIAALADGSTNTQRMLISGITGKIEEMYFLNANRGIAKVNNGGNTTIQVTYDKGTTWEVIEESLNAHLGFIGQTSTVLQAFTQTANITQRLVLNTTGEILVIDQTPDFPTATSFVSVASLIDGATITYYGITSGGQLFKSNTLNNADDEVSYTSIYTIPSFTPKKLLVSKITGYKYFVVLGTTGQLRKVQFNTTTSVYSLGILSSANAGYAFSDVMINPNSGAPYIMAYDDVNRVLNYLSMTSITGGQVMPNVATTTSMTLWPAAATIKAIAMNGDKVTLVGKSGRMFTTSAFTTGSPTVTLTNRSSLYFTPINEITASTHAGTPLLAAGDNGMFLRYASTSPSTELTVGYYVVPLEVIKDINGVANSIDRALLVGDQGYAESINLTSLTRMQYSTSLGLSIAAGIQYKNLYGVLTRGEKTYLFGQDGVVLYSDNQLILPFRSISNPVGKDLKGGDLLAVAGSLPPRAVLVGNESRIFKVQETSGSEIKDAFGPKYNDVHFANGQMGTLVGDHYIIRSTVDGGNTWKMHLPSASVANANINNLFKVWTKPAPNGGHFAMTAGNNYFTTVDASGFTTSTFNAIAGDIGFRDEYYGYILANTVGGSSTANGLRSMSLVGAVNTYTVTISSDLATVAQQMNALHVFENYSVMVVGASNGINYFTVGSSSYTSMSGAATGTFNDVYFHDNTVGYVVGNAGKFYRVTATGLNPANQEILGLTHLSKDLSDGVVTSGTQSSVNIKAIAFGSRYKGAFGGSFASGTFTTETKPYARLLLDQSDEFTSRFYYDRLGRIVVSQNSRQKAQNKYSYTLYDGLGRVTEAGEKTENGSGVQFASIFGATVGGQTIATVISDTKLNTWLTLNPSTRKEVTHNYYDKTSSVIAANGLGAYYSFNDETQRKRIVHVTYESVYDGNPATYDHATHYDYDIHGSVVTLIQDNKKLGGVSSGIVQHRFKQLDYNYDLISGNVHRVDYQTGSADQWHHAYNYDADNRITKVFTTSATPLLDPEYGQASANNELELNPMWDKEAEYEYYAHGPLARTVLGDQEVQGVDYVYTVQGWMKGVNSNTLDDTRDPGRDGNGLSVNHAVAKDVHGYSLHYYTGDYTGAIPGNDVFIANQDPSSDLGNIGPLGNSYDMYNGNIGRMVTTITDPDTRDILPLGMGYKYDQLNRLRNAIGFTNLDITYNTWDAWQTGVYGNSFIYDASGNIEEQVRQDESSNTIDDLIYKYDEISPGKKIRNRLYAVTDGVGTGVYTDDIDNMSFTSGATINTANNYSYDQEGRLIKDVQEGISEIAWRADGKVKHVKQDGTVGSHKSVSFDYDAMGHRIAKHTYDMNPVYNGGLGRLLVSTYYIVDGQGNTIATYDMDVDYTAMTIAFAEKERYIYGSSRLGVLKKEVPMFGTQNETYDQHAWVHEIGERSYELSNHLGNVLTVISDIPIPHDNGSGGVDYFLADILQSSDYSPFGVQLRKRNYTKTDLISGLPIPDGRFGFNGMEEDDQIKDDGNSYDFGARIYDSRLGRWLSLDPLTAKYPGMSPYNSFGNNPILYIDQDGKDYGVYVNHDNKTITVKQTIHTVKGVDANNAHLGAAKWNAESEKWQYVDGSGETYTIMFELTVKEYDDAAARDAAFAADNSGEGNLFKTSPLRPGLHGNTTQQLSGSGYGYNHVEAQNTEFSEEHNVYAHEIGHTLGLDHFTEGLMEDGSTNNSSFITLGNISRMLSYAGIGNPIETASDLQLARKSPGDKATPHQEGTAPTNFSTGKVNWRKPSGHGGSGMGQLYLNESEDGI